MIHRAHRPISYAELPRSSIKVSQEVFVRIVQVIDLLPILRGTHRSFPGVLLEQVHIDGDWIVVCRLEDKREYFLKGVTLTFVGNSATQLAVMEQFLAALARDLNSPLPAKTD